MLKSVFCLLVLTIAPLHVTFATSVRSYAQNAYRETCYDITESYGSDVVTATCPSFQGRKIRSSMDTSICPRGVINQNGHLMCLGAPSSYRNLPDGSYKETCKNCRDSGGVLTCRCIRINADERNTRLDYHECESSIENLDGVLSCN